MAWIPCRRSFLPVQGGMVSEVEVAVDDERAVKAFWADEPEPLTLPGRAHFSTRSGRVAS